MERYIRRQEGIEALDSGVVKDHSIHTIHIQHQLSQHWVECRVGDVIKVCIL